MPRNAATPKGVWLPHGTARLLRRINTATATRLRRNHGEAPLGEPHLEVREDGEEALGGVGDESKEVAPEDQQVVAGDPARGRIEHGEVADEEGDPERVEAAPDDMPSARRPQRGPTAEERDHGEGAVQERRAQQELEVSTMPTGFACKCIEFATEKPPSPRPIGWRPPR